MGARGDWKIGSGINDSDVSKHRLFEWKFSRFAIRRSRRNPSRGFSGQCAGDCWHHSQWPGPSSSAKDVMSPLCLAVAPFLAGKDLFCSWRSEPRQNIKRQPSRIISPRSTHALFHACIVPGCPPRSFPFGKMGRGAQWLGPDSAAASLAVRNRQDLTHQNKFG